MTDVLIKPRLVSPTSGAALDASAASFAWAPAAGAAGYRLQIAASPGFAKTLVDLDVGQKTEITVTDTLQPTGEARFWRVGAVDASGEVAWSPPSPFRLPSPEARAAERAEAAAARQVAQAGARQKRNRGIPDVPELPPPPALAPLPTGATVSGEPSATQWARVPGVATPAQEITAASGDAPRLLGPLGGEIADGSAVAFRWKAVPNAEAYEIEVAPEADFSGPTLRLAAGETTELALSGVLPASGDRLFWRVRARNSAGAGPWSRYGRFYAGTDLQAIAYRTRQEAEQSYAQRVREHEEMERQTELDFVAPSERPDAITDDAVAGAVIGILSLCILMGLIVAIGGMVTL